MQNSPLFLLQQNFSRLIKAKAVDDENLQSLQILSQDPIPPQGRLSIYQHAYYQRMYESFAEDFSKVKEVLDKNENCCNVFIELVDEYLKFYPSYYWSMAEVGKNFSKFISGSAWGLKYEFLADLAQFEWFKILSHLAPSPNAFDFSSVSHIESDKQQNIILKLSPSVYLFKSAWALHKLDLEQIISKEDSLFVIYQKEGQVFHNPLLQFQWDILKKISQEFSIGQIIAFLPNVCENEITNYFSFLVVENIISHFTLEREDL